MKLASLFISLVSNHPF